jgi:hypothetical protein
LGGQGGVKHEKRCPENAEQAIHGTGKDRSREED